MSRKIGVLTSGGDAPGMNAAIRAVVRSALSKGMEVYGVHRGYNGLINGDVFKMDERSVSDIIHQGGTVLYTARCPEFRTQEGVAKAKAKCDELGIEGLVVIGGDGSFRGAADLSAMGMVCVGIPGTIDNDISCTDYTIGFDTAMNTAMELVDKLRDTSQSHDRISVVEVMGRGCGDIALSTAIACGAAFVAIPEIPFDEKVAIERIKTARANGKRGMVVIVSEGVFHTDENGVHHLALCAARMDVLAMDDAVVCPGLEHFRDVYQCHSSRCVGVRPWVHPASKFAEMVVMCSDYHISVVGRVLG